MLQEADLARHRSRMVSEGRLEDIAGANLRPRRHLTMEESVQTFEVRADDEPVVGCQSYLLIMYTVNHISL